MRRKILPSRTAAVLAAAGLLLLLGSAGFLLYLRFSSFPELDRFVRRGYSTAVTDRKGRPLRILPLEDGLRREYVPLEEIPSAVTEIFIAAEDRRFFMHPGVDGTAVIRSLFQTVRAGRVVSGASTITMQLARMISPGEKSVSGKFKEILYALKIEARFSKREILEYWINTLPFGRRAEGIQTGCRTYFSKPVTDLSVPEALILSVIPRSPRDLDPFDHPEAAAAAAVRTSARCRLPTDPAELFAAAAAAAEEAAAGTAGWDYEAPHFLAAAERAVGMAVESAAEQGRRAVRTSLDLEIQHRLEGLLRYALEKYRHNRIHNGGAVVIDNRTGEIRAYTGSGNFFSLQEGSKIDAVEARNQPGSCIKPFLYALALEEGFEPYRILPDIPLEFGTSEVYTPFDFDNRFRGPVRFRVALGSSLNIPAVYLLEQLGVDKFSRFLVHSGFRGPAEDIALSGLGLSLGSREVSLLELVRGFSMFPRGGTLPELRFLPIHSPQAQTEERIISKYSAGIICSILSDKSARIAGFGSAFVFETPFPSMFKTGTANQFQDIWALAATTRYTVGVWMGNLWGDTVIGRTGSSVPAEIARELLLFLHGASGEPFPEPPGTETVSVCILSGKAAGPACPAAADEYVRENIDVCDYHIGTGKNVETVYPGEYTGWLHLFHSADAGISAAGPAGPVRIVHPKDGAVFFFDPSEPADVQAVRVQVLNGSRETDLLINGVEETGFSNSRDIWYFPLRKGRWTIEVRDRGKSDGVSIEVR